MIETSTSIKNIDKKIFVIQSEAPVIKKEADNPYFRSKYAEYPEIQAKIRPLLLAQSLLVSFMPVSGNMLTMYVKDTESAEYYKVTSDLNAIGVSPQAQGSAITYLKRYMITAFFDLIIEDGMDDDGNSGSNAKPKQQNNQQVAAPAAEDKRTWLNQNTQTWFDAKLWVFNSKGTLEKVNKKYRISKENSEILMKPEDLKPGNKLWDIAAKYLSKENSKAVDLVTAFNISDADLQDLQVDAINITDTNPEALTKTDNATK